MTDLTKQLNFINKLQQTHIQKQKVIMQTIIIYGEQAQIYQQFAAIHHHAIHTTVPFINFLEIYINLLKPHMSEIRNRNKFIAFRFLETEMGQHSILVTGCALDDGGVGV